MLIFVSKRLVLIFLLRKGVEETKDKVFVGKTKVEEVVLAQIACQCRILILSVIWDYLMHLQFEEFWNCVSDIYNLICYYGLVPNFEKSIVVYDIYIGLINYMQVCWGTEVLQVLVPDVIKIWGSWCFLFNLIVW